MSGFASNLGSNLVANVASDGLSSNNLVSSGVKSLFKMTPKGKFQVGSRALDDALEVVKEHDRYISGEHKQSLSKRIKELWDERSKYPPHIHILDIRTQLKIASQAEAFMTACLEVHRDAKRVSKESVLDGYIKDSGSPPGDVPTTPLVLDTSEGESSQAAAVDLPPVPRKRPPPPVPPRRALNTSEGEAVNRPTLVNDPPGPPPPPRTSPPTLEIPNSGFLHEPNVNASTSRVSPSRRRPPLPPPPSPSKSLVYPPAAEPDFPVEDPFAG